MMPYILFWVWMFISWLLVHAKDKNRSFFQIMFIEWSAFLLLWLFEAFLISQWFKYIEGFDVDVRIIVAWWVFLLAIPNVVIHWKKRITRIRFPLETIIWWLCFLCGLLLTSIALNQFIG